MLKGVPTKFGRSKNSARFPTTFDFGREYFFEMDRHNENLKTTLSTTTPSLLCEKTCERWSTNKQESPADADKPARRERMQKLFQFDVFRFISPNSISPNFKLPMHSVARYVYALDLYGYTQ